MGVVPVKTVNARRKKGDGFWSGLWGRFRSSFWAGLWIKFQDGCRSIFRGNFWQKFSKFSAFKLPKKSTKANLSRSSAKVVALPVIGSGRLSRLSRLGIGIGSSGQRQRWPLLIGILAILALLPAFLFYNWLAPEAEAGWFDTSYSFRQRVPVGNSSGENKTNFQVKITLDTASLIASGKLQSECQDARFTNINGQVLPHWIEPNTCNTSETLVWTKVPSIPTDGTDLYFYYGNPSANSTADTQKVFIRDMESAAAAWPMQEEASTTLSYAAAKHPSDSEGRDIVINGGFDTDSIWVKGTGWTISDGVAHANIADGNSLRQDSVPIIQGKTYQFVYTISNYSSGSIQVRSGSNLVNGTLRSANGTYTENIVGGDSSRIAFWSVGGFVGDIDNVLVKQINIPSSGDFDGSELVTDGDMEAADTNAWIAQNNATISKETTNPHGGSQVLRIAYNGTSNPIAAQTGVVETGKRYRVHGFARSDGVSVPRLYVGTTASIWVGDTSTTWQEFDIETISTGSEFKIYASLSVSGYVEFDDVSVTEISPLSGSTPTDDSTNRPTLGADSSSGHLSNAYTFDGSNDYVDIYSSDLNSVFNPDEGTLVAWAKVSDSSVWSDGAADWIVNMRVDSNNIVQFFENNGNLYTYYYAGGTQKSISHATTTTEWFQVVLTWNASSDEAKFYFNGSQQGSTQTGLGTWIGNLSSTQSVIGALNNSGNSSWSGDINDVRLYNRALSTEEIADLYSTSTDIQAYYTDNYEGQELIRKYDDDNITVGSLGSEEVGPGPVAYWKFDEGADNTCPGGEDVCDSTSNGNDGTFTGSPEWQSEDMCINGKCLYFDGTGNNYASLTANSALNVGTGDFTISAWVKTHDSTANQSIIEKGSTSSPCDSSGSKGYTLRLLGGAPGIRLNTGSAQGCYTLTADSALSANTWYYVSAVVDRSGNAEIYVNGSSVKSSDVSSYTNSLDGNSITRIGILGTTFPMNGSIDEVKIYPYARTEAQIKADYNQFAAVLGLADQGNLSDGLVGYWSMDESSGTTVADKSGNGNNGTLTNAQENGTSDGSGNSTTTLVDTDGTLSSTDDAYNGMVLSITDDATCPLSADAERIISDYDGTTKTFTVSAAFSAAPDTCNYTVLHQVGGKFGNGVRFDSSQGNGQHDYVNLGTSSTYDFAKDFSVSAWIKTSSTDNHDKILFKGNPYADASTGGYYLHSHGGYAAFGVDLSSSTGNNYSALDNSTPINDNQWHHLVGVWNNDILNLYVDGRLVTTKNLPAGSVITGITNSLFTISGSSYGFFGSIDEVRTYNRPLSASEVQQLYQWAPGPVGYWDFNEGSGDTAFDKSGNGYNGTLNDSPTWTQGKYGGGIEFDGTNNRSVDITGASASSLELNHESITLSAWVKPRVNGVSSGIVRKGQGTMRSGYGYMITSGNQVMMIYSDTYDSGDHRASFGSTNADEWIYITQVIDKENNIAKGYINGIYQTSMSIAGIASVNSGHSFVIGEDNAYDANAVIDEVKIYNYARTAEQIRQDMVGSGQVSSVGGGPLPKPIAHWSFDEQGGQATHDSIADNDGTLGADASVGSDDPTWKTGSECKLGGCLGFDGDDDVVSISSNIFSIGTNDATVSLWAKISEAGTNNRLFGTPSGYGYDVWIKSDGRLTALGGDKASSRVFADSNTPYDDDSWHHIVAVYDRDYAISLYVDGILQDDVETGFTNYSNIDYNFTTATIGNLLSSGWGPVGLIDEVKIYNSALTAEQVRLDMNSGSPLVFGGSGEVSEAADLADGAGNPPVVEWRLDEKTGSVAYDTSGNGNDGEITGANWTSGCRQGACLSFDGDDDNVNINSLNSSITGKTLTMNAWLNLNNLSGIQRVITNGSGSSTSFGFGSSNMYVHTYTDAGNDVNTPYLSLPSNCQVGWHFFSVSWDTSLSSNQVKVYCDGRNIGSGNLVNAINGNFSISSIMLGYANDSQSLDGLIDHVKIYDYARTPAQIAYDYNRGKPIAHYKFDECEGNTVHDSSDNENHGTLTVTTSGGNTAGIGTCSVNNSAWGSGSEGKFGSSLNFDGDGDYVQLTSNIASYLRVSENYSVSAWFNTNSVSGNNTILNFYNSADSSRHGILLGGSNLIAGYYKNSYVGTVTPGIQTGTWYHVMVVNNAGSITTYLNGVPDLDGTPSSLGTDNRVGYSSPNGDYFEGQIDDVRVYNYALSPAQVRKLYNGGAAIRFGE